MYGGFFVLRTPLLPATSTTSVGDDLDLARHDPIIGEALRRASASIAAALDSKTPQRDPAAMEGAVRRYLARMKHRPTPFGLMAGYAFGKTSEGETQKLVLGNRADYVRHLRLDNDAVATIVGAAERVEEWVARSDLLFYPDMVRCTQRTGSGEVTYVDVARTKALDALILAARTPSTIDTLATSLEEFGSGEAIRGFIAGVIDARLLVPSVHPALNASDELAPLRRLGSCSRIVTLATSIRDRPLSVSVAAEEGELDGALRAVGASVKGAIITDVSKPLVSGTLGRDLLVEIRRVVKVLQRTVPPKQDTRFKAFKERFLQRYEMREVPLVEALDAARGYDFPVQPPPDPEPIKSTLSWQLKLLTSALRAGSETIALTEQDLPGTDLWQVPPASSIRFQLACDDQRRPLVIHGPVVMLSPTSMFARAASFVPALRDATRDFLARAAVMQGVDVADLSYIVAGKTAAVAQMPTLQPFDIPLCARTATSPDQSIDVNDLLVSVTGDTVRLRSRKTGRLVFPMAAGALNANFSESTSLVRFLYAFSFSEPSGGGWSWGPLDLAAYLPRVTFGPHTLAAARWRLDAKDTAAIRAAKTPEQRWDQVQLLRESLRLPRMIGHVVDDNVLVVDLDDRQSVAMWLPATEMLLTEVFPVSRSAVSDGDGLFQHELVVPLYNGYPGDLAPIEQDAPNADGYLSGDLVFDRELPGGDVLYVKIYGDRNELTSVVAEVHEELLAPHIESGDIDRWFFLPYADPDPHIRLRVFGASESLHSSLVPALRGLLADRVEKRIIRRLDIDTYDRETYRYGGRHGLALVERLFQLSSELALELHGGFDVLHENDDTVILATVEQLRAMLLTSLDLQRALDCAKNAYRSYLRDNDSVIVRRNAGEIVRERKTEMAAFRTPDEVLGETLVRWQDVVREMGAAHDRGNIERSIDGILTDLMHVHSLRVLTTWHPSPLEPMIYAVLEKHLAAELARSKTRRG
jgi:thiopeptide-type bacteriocin biosynthesis protein